MKKKIFKNTTGVIITGILIGVLIVGGGIFLYYSYQESKGDKEGVITEKEIISSVSGIDTIRSEDDLQSFKSNWDYYIDGKDLSTESNIGAYLTYAQEGGSRYDCDTPIMKVGEETIYGCDLNVQFVMRDFKDYVEGYGEDFESNVLASMIDEVIIQSGLLQKGAELNIIELDELFYNSPDKSMSERFDKVDQVREELEAGYIKRIDYEVITIYFHNQEEPENIPLEEAKEIAYEKMEILYNRLKSGEITMEEAGDEIKNDNITGDTTGISLEDLDPIYEQNSYIKVIGREYGKSLFKDSSADDIVRDLDIGEISEILTLKDYKFTNEEFREATIEENFPLVDSCYAIIELNSFDMGENGVFVAETVEGINEAILVEYSDKLIII